MATDPAEVTSERGPTYRFLISPKWIGFHLLVLLLVVTMINLAFWQLRRLDERRQFNAQVRANANQPIAPFDELATTLANPSALEWRRVKVTGTFVADHQFLVVNRSQNGATGRNVVDALQLSDGTLLLVNRGFVSSDDATPAVPAGSIEIVGRLRESERRAVGQTADQGADALTEIRRIDIGVLSKQFDAAVVPMYIEQLDSTPPLQPIVEPNTDDEGPHLSYTIQWFIFTACVIAGWVLAVRRSVATRSGKVGKKRRSSYIPIADDEPVS
jgi:cytochrome oxidase assembly protein ShyY1